MDKLQAAVAARTQSILEDMVDTGLKIDKPSLLIVTDIVDMMHKRIDLDYLIDTLALEEIRKMGTITERLH